MTSPPEDARDFDAFYASRIQPDLLALEVQRKQIAGKLIASFLVVVALVAGCLMAFTFDTISVTIASFVGIVLFMGQMLFYRWMTSDYVLSFKHQVIAAVARYFDEGLRYDPEAGISQSDFLASQLFRHRIDRYSGEDLVRGVVGKTAIEVSEIHAEYKTTTTDSKGRRRTRWHTIFRGLFFIGDFNKHFQGTTLVLPDVAERLLGRFGKMLQDMNPGRSQDLVRLEDPEFEKHFVVYGDDQVESRYILSPALMQRIVAFKRSTGHQIHLAFRHSNVYVAISATSDMFEPPVFRTLLNRQLVETYRSEMAMAVGIVEELNLNTRIWTKT
ncbi:MAG: DUF3137 domain-containing protein [Myxococcota bacterium]|nr:DUF3137 domain-containing protein [Myxococcota bacterium]